MSEPDHWIALQRRTLAALHAEPHRADLWAIFNEVALRAWVMVEVLQRADPAQGATMSPAQWQRECRGMMREQAAQLAAMLAPGWPPREPCP